MLCHLLVIIAMEVMNVIMEVMNVIDITEVMNAMDITEVMNIIDITEVMNIMDITEVMLVMEVMNIMDITEVMLVMEVMNVIMEVTDVTEANDLVITNIANASAVTTVSTEHHHRVQYVKSTELQYHHEQSLLQ
jgi:hypothetical protein